MLRIFNSSCQQNAWHNNVTESPQKACKRMHRPNTYQAQKQCIDQISSPSRNSEQDLLSEVTLSEIRKSSKDKLIIGNLNLNSLPHKFDQLKLMIQGKIDILVITETKLDDSFPSSQFHIEGFTKPYRYDRNRNGGGVLIYVREDIPCKILPQCVESDIRRYFLKLIFVKPNGFYVPVITHLVSQMIISFII